MKRFFTFVGLLIASVAPLVAFAKGELVRIEVTGPALSAPLVVADTKVLRQLFIWSGPGAGQPIGSPQSVDSGSFIDWHEGIAKNVPEGTALYDVSFYCVFDKQQPGGRLTYAVKYAYDATTQRGYIYLPGPGEENYGLNVSAVIHDVEGHWFRASSRWESLVAPLIQERAVSSADDVAARVALWPRPLPYRSRSASRRKKSSI
jgi:hypothetical protein